MKLKRFLTSWLIALGLTTLAVAPYAQDLGFEDEKEVPQETPVVKEGSGTDADSARQDAVVKFVKEMAKNRLSSDEYDKNREKLERLVSDYNLAKEYVIISKENFSAKHQKIKILVAFKPADLKKDLAGQVVEGESVAEDEEVALNDAKSKALIAAAEANLDPKTFRRSQSILEKLAAEKAGKYVQILKKGSFNGGKLVVITLTDWERARNEINSLMPQQTNESVMVIGDTGFLVVVPPYDRSASVRVNKTLLSELTAAAVKTKLQKFYHIKSYKTLEEALEQSKTEFAARGIDVRLEKDALNWLFLAETTWVSRIFIDKVEVQKDPIRNGYCVYINLRMEFTHNLSRNVVTVQKSSFDITLEQVDTSKGEYAGGYPTGNIGVEQAAREAIKIVSRALSNELLRTIRDDLPKQYAKVTFEGFSDTNKREKLIKTIRAIEKEGIWEVKSLNTARAMVNVELDFKRGGGLETYILEKFKPFYMQLGPSAAGRLIFQSKMQEE